MKAAVGLCLAALFAGQAAWAKPRTPGLDEDLLPGWKSETHRQPQEQKKPWMEVLSEEARVFLFHGLLTEAECDHIVRKAEPRLERSGVVDTGTGGTEISDIRTSKGMFFGRGEDSVLQDIEERIARWTLLPAGNGEGLQVLRYGIGQEYKPHWDYFFHKEGTSNGGNRYATVLMYLSDVEEGGETIFPNLPAPASRDSSGYSECAKPYVAVKPRKGDAVLFHSIKPNGELERRSMHGACPVIRGVKYSAAKWIHVGHYAAGNEQAVDIQQHIVDDGTPEGCQDTDQNCPGWADSGECQKNSGFMVGTRQKPGACLKSCDRCDLLAGGGNGKVGGRKFGGAQF